MDEKNGAIMRQLEKQICDCGGISDRVKTLEGADPWRKAPDPWRKADRPAMDAPGLLNS